MYKIRKIRKEETSEALSLATEVFMEYEAPDYGEKGTEAFLQSMVNNPEFIKSCEEGRSPVYAAFDDGKIIGIMGMRENSNHINMAYIKKEYHRRGVGTSLFNYLLNDITKADPTITKLTLNSSPYGLPFYYHLGFTATMPEQEIDGIRFTPMEYIIK